MQRNRISVATSDLFLFISSHSCVQTKDSALAKRRARKKRKRLGIEGYSKLVLFIPQTPSAFASESDGHAEMSKAKKRSPVLTQPLRLFYSSLEHFFRFLIEGTSRSLLHSVFGSSV